MPSSLRLYPDQPILLIHVCGVSHIHSLSSPSIVATRAIVVTWWTLLVGPRSGRSNNGSVWWVYSSKGSTRRTGARAGRRSASTSANQACGSTSFIFADKAELSHPAIAASPSRQNVACCRMPPTQSSTIAKSTRSLRARRRSLAPINGACRRAGSSAAAHCIRCVGLPATIGPSANYLYPRSVAAL